MGGPGEWRSGLRPVHCEQLAPRLPAVLFAMLLLCMCVFFIFFAALVCLLVTDSADDVERMLQSVMTHDMVGREQRDGM